MAGLKERNRWLRDRWEATHNFTLGMQRGNIALQRRVRELEKFREAFGAWELDHGCYEGESPEQEKLWDRLTELYIATGKKA